MQVGKRKPHKLNDLYWKRSQGSIAHALSTIRHSAIAPYVEQIYLYGSCARHEQTGKSDVDLFMQLQKNIDLSTLKPEILSVISNVVPVERDLPEVDLKIAIGDEWKNKKDLYYKNIRREGIPIWYT